jgi:hypothetical protein
LEDKVNILRGVRREGVVGVVGAEEEAETGGLTSAKYEGSRRVVGVVRIGERAGDASGEGLDGVDGSWGLEGAEFEPVEEG